MPPGDEVYTPSLPNGVQVVDALSSNRLDEWLRCCH